MGRQLREILYGVGRLTRVLANPMFDRGIVKNIISRDMNSCTCRRRIILDISRQIKITGTVFVNTLNSNPRREWPNAHGFRVFENVSEELKGWRRH